MFYATLLLQKATVASQSLGLRNLGKKYERRWGNLLKGLVGNVCATISITRVASPRIGESGGDRGTRLAAIRCGTSRQFLPRGERSEWKFFTTVRGAAKTSPEICLVSWSGGAVWINSFLLSRNTLITLCPPSILNLYMRTFISNRILDGLTQSGWIVLALFII